ncbi:MAG: HAD family phosphatase [Dehalococcoidia bacterium]|nr:MAG: HAD family phosphatase [Dehalococcoidia bacterium]
MARHEVRALIFDMDGVLADTEPLFYAATRDAMHPHPFTEAEYEQFIGTHGLEKWLTTNHGFAPDFLRTRILPTYHEMLERGLEAMAGAAGLLDAARARGLPVAVASASSHDSIERTLRAIGLRDHFPLVVSADDVARTKPAPDVYLHTARLLGVTPEMCLAIEDSVHGIVSASTAGMRVVQSRQATYVPPPHPAAHAVIESLEHFEHAWLDGGFRYFSDM